MGLKHFIMKSDQKSYNPIPFSQKENNSYRDIRTPLAPLSKFVAMLKQICPSCSLYYFNIQSWGTIIIFSSQRGNIWVGWDMSYHPKHSISRDFLSMEFLSSPSQHSGSFMLFGAFLVCFVCFIS